MWESTNPNTGEKYSLGMILMDDINRLTISDVCLLVILLFYLFCSSDMFVIVNFYIIYFVYMKKLFMHYLFAPFKQLLSEDCLYSIKK